MQLIAHGPQDMIPGEIGQIYDRMREAKTTLTIKSPSGKSYKILYCPLDIATTLTVELLDGTGKEYTYNIRVSTERNESLIRFKTSARGGFIGELMSFCKDCVLTYSLIEMFIIALGFVPLYMKFENRRYTGEKFESTEEFYARRKPVTMIKFMDVQIPKVIYDRMSTAVTLTQDTGAVLTLDDIPENLKPHIGDALRALNKSRKYSFTIENMAVYDFLGLLDTLAEWSFGVSGMFINGDEVIELTLENALKAGFTMKDARSVPYSFRNAHKHVRDLTLINNNIMKLLKPYQKLKSLTKGMKFNEIDIMAFTHLVRFG